MRKIGQASFSIYLMHILVFYFGGHLLGLRHGVYSPLWIPLGVFAVVLPMIASHYIEMPLQRMTRKWLEVVIPSKFGRALPQPN
jgi:peptidoglycan/LPS O-acetylase OafA/YrhL